LDTHPTESQSDPLLAWCRTVVTRHAGNWPPRESVLAGDFVSFFGPDSCTTLESLRQLCARLGIDVSVRLMPSDIRGHNSVYLTKRAIVLSEHQPLLGADEHTLLHELREIVEHIFKELGGATCDSAGELEIRAESFAGLVRSEAFSRQLSVFFQTAEQIENKWVRYGTFFLIGLGGLAFVCTCIFLPQLEHAVTADELRKRNVRT
jgi:hypothetical protein